MVSNSGDTSLPVSLRVDNAGHWKGAPWSTETIRLNPGDTKTLVVFFGHSHGWKPAFALDPSAVTQLLFFTNGAEKERAFSVLSVAAVGDPGQTPEEWQKESSKAPVDGVLYSHTAGLLSLRQLSTQGGATVSNEESGLSFRFSGPESSVTFLPPSGQWDLRQANHVEITFLNESETPVRPLAWVGSRGGPTSKSQLKDPLAPGETGSLLIPFASSDPWNAANDSDIGEYEGGTGFVSGTADSVTISPGEGDNSGSLRVTHIVATAPHAELPDWLGKRPPVEGDWVLTLQEDFASPGLDESTWNVFTTNHWDKRSHFSRSNVLQAEDQVRLRYEKKEGKHNDDPNEVSTAYATGFLDTFGKWRQRYGYFESRLKLPSAPGLWPAFWMMPDRGPDDAPRWKREQTTNGGMEFDIMEYLSGWGPYRYNVAFHWDGYGKGHRNAGTSGIYTQHDEEGFITVGMLWLPGEVTYFCNGKPVGHWESERVSNVASILMFTHVSGGWDNDPIDDTKLPSDFVIDYVRVWQRSDLQD